MKMTERLQTRVEGIPVRRRLWSAGTAGAIYFACGLAIAVPGVQPDWKWSLSVGMLISLITLVTLGNELTARLAPNTKRRLFTLSNFTSTAGYLGLAALSVWVLTMDRGAGITLLALVAFANYFMSGGRASNEQPISLTQLRTRITRRVAFRIIAITAATLALVLSFTLARPNPDQQNTNFTFAIGTCITAGGACLKVHSRARKLCTQINAQAQSLILALDSFTASTTDQVDAHADNVRREWLQLSQMLRNRIETGLPLHSTAMLPISNRHRLQGLINLALADTPRGTLFASQARAELHAVAAACATRIDTTL